MDSTSSSAALEEKRELSEQEVLEWLSRRGFARAHAALVAETSSQALTNDDSPARQRFMRGGAEEVTTNGATPTSAELQAALRDSVVEALSAYRDLARDDNVLTLLERWDPQLCSLHVQRAAQRSEENRGRLERRVQAAEESNAQLRTRERKLDAQMKQIVAIIAERLQALASSLDPMRKDILLPLLRIVALLGSSGTVRAAARHMMLTLYKRPMMEHRMTVVQEWLRVAQESPSRTLEQELIPELYTLVNAQAFERRLLALDCAAAVAPLLRRSPQVRYSLCQGLLRPLCEDDMSAVRRELPRCLSLLWGDATATGTTAAMNAPASAGGMLRSSVGGGLPSETTTVHSSTAHTSVEGLPGVSTTPLSPTQQTFFMELLVHLATDSNSRTVRQAAQTQLCEVLYPVFLRDGVLLTQFVPLLLTVMEMEATQWLLRRRPDNSISSAAALGTANAALIGERQKDPADESSTSAAAALSLSNVMTLIQLLHAVLRCVAAELVHSPEAEGRCDRCEASDDSQTSSALPSAYAHVVLPIAYNLLSNLLSKVHLASLTTSGEGGTPSGSDASTRLCGPLCALCATLASLVPLLGAQVWQEVAHYLKGPLASGPQQDVEAAAVREGTSEMTTARPPPPPLQPLPPQSPMGASLTQQDLERGRLLFVFSFFLFLCGDAVTLPQSGGDASAADNATAPERQGQTADLDALTSSTALPSESLTPECIREESLRFVAWSISLESEDISCPRSAPLMACIRCVAALTPLAMESHEVASGISGLVKFLVASPEVRQRLTAVVLAHDTCAVLASERLKVALLIEPLFPLLEDPQPAVQEAALSGVLSVSVALTEPRAQEKAIRPVLRVADATGCTSRFTRCLLQQLYQLMQRMPAEPREALLYPQLSLLMDCLAELCVERVSQEGFSAAPAVATPSSLVSTSAGARIDPQGRAGSEQRDLGEHDWEETMLVLHAVLSSIVKCAVVTPTLLYRYLLPGIQQLSSDGILSACSPSLRSRWLRLQKNYQVFMENNNASRLASSCAASAGGKPKVGTLLDRFKDELKRRL
ncbi:conserved hypothetical protein [Leishmania major strain Friedlin]|uniref:LisH domain-containing protein n=1 Tax=Leishmania major TaxID=5664 RepID=Q4Q0N4_LEIMA|nr:conserved hypothetical protein [Leishmania major strain Friedlin]CAG9584080.1 hypothetical_protein_-_conserved [Leishmania major strain Friedlin]CAJ09500.1 conserved hypothetical protein [Leishmania major strain Friedlin]|eukprot:XP_001687114.1 conserved hypothetical protein [Leishmania major strain Friedlin]